MKIALLGYGRMGKEIEKIALERGHEIVLKVADKQSFNITKADVAIDFSIPSAAFDNITHCFTKGIPVVSGTTGWLHQYDEAVDICTRNQGAFIYTSNFSLGVNIFFEINQQLAKLMKPLKNYHTEIEEIHHTKKLDAPSGTAISLAEGIIKETDYLKWELKENQFIGKESIPIKAKRIPEVPGTHLIEYKSEVDSIEIKHTAHNRQGFALGAVIAAEWILGKSGVFTMKDVLNIG